MLSDFKAFVMRGNVLDLAVGVIIGAAFGGIVNSLVNDIIMPPIGVALGNVDFSNMFTVLKAGTPPPPYASLALANTAGAVTLNYGVFITRVVTFLLVAFSVYMLIKAVSRLQPPTPAAVTTKDCQYCRTAIPLAATRCPNCTSELRAA
jgi:large conductance mechanosensitive channel